MFNDAKELHVRNTTNQTCSEIYLVEVKKRC